MSDIKCPEKLSQEEQDLFWMSYAQQLAEKAEQAGEIPVGAVIVLDNQWVAEGWNHSIKNHDPTAHAEIIALQNAGKAISNYRLLDATLYVTLEPCPMCAGAMVHARINRLVFGAYDSKTGAAGSVVNLTNFDQLNHQLNVTGGVKQQECSTQISNFFKKRRQQHKQQKAKLKSELS